jgi:hypothetical protein
MGFMVVGVTLRQVLFKCFNNIPAMFNFIFIRQLPTPNNQDAGRKTTKKKKK